MNNFSNSQSKNKINQKNNDTAGFGFTNASLESSEADFSGFICHYYLVNNLHAISRLIFVSDCLLNNSVSNKLVRIFLQCTNCI